ncbi:MAG TPA: GAF domain-containing protein [Blastocatellia bacterium]|nr:GAF domain-containing protein [Blastocatellia bacterium]
MSLSFLSSFFSARRRPARGCALIQTITTQAQTSHDLTTALQCATDEIGRTFRLERAAIMLFDERGVRRIGDYSAEGVGPVEREKLRQLDLDLTDGTRAQTSLIEISDTRSDPRVSRRMAPLAGGAGALSICSILIAPVVVDSQAAGALVLYRREKRKWSDQERHVIQAAASTLGLTIHHFRSQERAISATGREALSNRLLTAIRSAVGVNDILKVAVDGIGTTLKVTRVVTYMHRKGDLGRDWSFTACAEYRSSVLVPTLIQTELDLEGSPLLANLLSGEVINIPDTSEGDPIVRAIGVRLGVRAMVLAPVRYNGQTVAAIALEQFDHPRVFSKDEIKLLELVTEQTAVALYQAELIREAQEAARRDALISKISSAIHSSLDSETVLQTIVNELGTALSVCRCRLALLPSPLPEMVPVTHEFVADCCARRPSVLNEIQTVNNPFLQAVLSQDNPIAVSDPYNDPGFAPLRSRIEAGNVKAILTVAVRVDGRPTAILSLHHCEQPHTWTAWEADLVKSVADQAAVAIRQAELYREVRESAQRASLVNQIVASIRRSLDLTETLQVAVEEVGRALGADRTSFRKFIGKESVVVAEHLSDPSLSVSHIHGSEDDYVANYLLETRRTLVINDVPAFAAAYPDLASTVRVWQLEPMYASQIVSPIFVNGEGWGALSISQIDRVRKWSASEITLVEMVAAQIEVAVSHSRLFEETKQAAEREALISHISHGINQSNRLDEILPIVARELGEHLAADRILLTKFNPESERWVSECEYSQGRISRPETSYSNEDFLSYSSLFENNVFRCDNSEEDPRLDARTRELARADGSRSFMSVWISFDGSARLVITAIMKSAPRTWTDDEVEVIRAAADQVVIALQRAELFELVSRGKVEWEATFDALNDGIFIFDSEGILRRVNEAAAAFEGTGVRELIGRRCCTLLQGIEGETCKVAQVMKSGRPATFELLPERLSRPVLVTIAPLANGSGSHSLGHQAARRNDNPEAPRGAVCIVRDLSEIRAAEAVAREQRSYLVKLIEHANDAILAFSPDGRLIWFNEQLVKQCGYSREELETGDYRLFVFGEEKKYARERFNRALEGEAQSFELTVVRKDGESRLLLVTHTPIYDEGRVTSVLTIARDVTEERLASERAAQADKLRALGQLASGVAHNFNNILAAILGHAQLIKRDSNDESLAQRIEIIEHAALDGAQTVKRIQAFGVQQTDSLDGAIDLNQLVGDSTTLTKARWCDEAQARGLQYKVEVDLQHVPPIQGSSSELKEVFVNIILNALDAMPQGGRLGIATEAQGDFATVSFSDSGIGMTSEVRDHLFEPFFTTKGMSGMGLGLAVSYSIVERHGGRIEVQSNPGHGTTFTISLPTAESAHRTIKPNRRARSRTANVLVIDDDQRVREALVGMLSAAGHRTDHAKNGHEALAKLERNQFDLVFTDLSMPEMDGWAVASEVRRRWPSVKVVLITGYAVPRETVEFNRDLVSEVISKPIRFDELSSTLNQVLA